MLWKKSVMIHVSIFFLGTMYIYIYIYIHRSCLVKDAEAFPLKEKRSASRNPVTGPHWTVKVMNLDGPMNKIHGGFLWDLPMTGSWIDYNGNPMKMDDLGAPLYHHFRKPPYIAS